MASFANLEKRIAALVHPGARANAAENARHANFILWHLMTAFGALAVAPLQIALFGAPSLPQVLVFVSSMLAFAAIAFISRTGRLRLAAATCSFGAVIVATIIAVGDGPLSQSAFAWFVLAPLEAMFSLDVALVAISGLAAGLAACGLAIAHLASGIGFAKTDFVPAGAAIACATVLALGLTRLQARREKSDRLAGERYSVLAETVGDLVLYHGATGQVEFVGRSCEAAFGIARGELMGRGFLDRVHVADRPAFLTAMADALKSSVTVVVTVRLRTAAVPSERHAFSDPVFLWIELRLRRFDLPGGAGSDGIVSVLRDVTTTKQHQEELEAARAAAEAANIAKDQFLANVSHELRTPLNAIIGFAEMLGNPQLAPRDPAKQLEYATIIRESGLHLLAVVNSILDVSKLQSGSFTIEPESFELPPLIDLCCDMVKLKAAEGRVELVRSYPETLAELVADKRACKQILINLLSNAVKFTPARGRVSLSARQEGNAIVLSVADTGIGIVATDLARLGDPFFQAKSSYDRPHEGTGLGLSVVRGLVGLHGGTMSIESEPERGTCVTIRLPQDGRPGTLRSAEDAKIETIPRRPRADEARDFPKTMTVKKIA